MPKQLSLHSLLEESEHARFNKDGTYSVILYGTDGAHNETNPNKKKFKNLDISLIILDRRAVIYGRKTRKIQCGHGAHGNAKKGWLAPVTHHEEDAITTTFTVDPKQAEDIVIKVSLASRKSIYPVQALLDGKWIYAYFTRQYLSNEIISQLRAKASQYTCSADLLGHINERIAGLIAQETQSINMEEKKIRALISMHNSNYQNTDDTQLTQLIDSLFETKPYAVTTANGKQPVRRKHITIMPDAGVSIDKFTMKIMHIDDTPLKRLLKTAKTIVAAIDELKRLHTKAKIGHGDISLGNICVKENEYGEYKATIVDYDTAGQLTDIVKRTQTEPYTTPSEDIRPTIQQSDIIALATCIYIKDGEQYLEKPRPGKHIRHHRHNQWSLLTTEQVKELEICRLLHIMKYPPCDINGKVTTDLDKKMDELRDKISSRILKAEMKNIEPPRREATTSKADTHKATSSALKAETKKIAPPRKEATNKAGTPKDTSSALVTHNLLTQKTPPTAPEMTVDHKTHEPTKPEQACCHCRIC